MKKLKQWLRKLFRKKHKQIIRDDPNFQTHPNCRCSLIAISEDATPVKDIIELMNKEYDKECNMGKRYEKQFRK